MLVNLLFLAVVDKSNNNLEVYIYSGLAINVMTGQLNILHFMNISCRIHSHPLSL